MARSAPAYRLHKARGLAVVTLTDCHTKHRKSYYLGPYGSAESKAEYHRIISEWETNGRRLIEQPPAPPTAGVTIAEIMADYLDHVEKTYSRSEVCTIKAAMTLLRKQAEFLPAATFGPNRLRDVRDAMVDKGWNRKHINKQIQRLQAIFRWAGEHELIPLDTYTRLKLVSPLRKGKSKAPEGKPVTPVDDKIVDATCAKLPSPVVALIRLQQYTGARAGELIGLRPIDLDMSGEIWKAELHQHKTAHHGKARVLLFGPKSQRVIRPFLSRPIDEPLFSPREAYQETRRSNANSKRRDDQKPTPRQTDRRMADQYTTASYRRAIHRACDKAKVARWSPHQLRHAAATKIRARFDLESAAIILGHGSAALTDQVYAQRDLAKGIAVAKKIG